MNKLSRANRGVQTVRKTGEDIEEQIINHLVKNGNIGKYQIEHISRGNAGFSENNSVILSWQDETYPENLKLLREKISAKPNQDLNYTSPIEIFDPRSEKLVNSRDGMLFYIAIKFKKDHNRNIEVPDESESDSGMGDSGQSQNDDVPDLPQTQWNVSQDQQEKFNKFNFNINQTKKKTLFPGRKENIDILKINTTERSNKIMAEKNNSMKPLLSREEIRRRYTRIKKFKKIPEKKIPEKKPGEEKKTKPMWLAANVNSFNANFKRSPCYSFQCLPRIRNK